MPHAAKARKGLALGMKVGLKVVRKWPREREQKYKEEFGMPPSQAQKFGTRAKGHPSLRRDGPVNDHRSESSNQRRSRATGSNNAWR
mmetsp:Transcript_38074/g.80630  ORF Transcript_38074/g.80630 Transcript_38074/m.80630 type:complete len:87 (+) Transcript_38074:46-306(+)